ncbi:MAG: helix-turn-helix domain-containing protein [Lachnoclostridium sp.]|nr:helix-turn-helix domain-containing protein [Lachnoclostridium sp.]
MSNLVNISQLTTLSKFSSEYSSLGNDYIFSRFTSPPSIENLSSGPIRIDGICWLACFEGSAELNINLDHVTLQPNTLVLTNPDSIIEINGISDDAIDCYCLLVSREFMHDLNFDINIISTLPRRKSFTPRLNVFNINPEDANLLRSYFDLIHYNTVSNTDDVYVRSIARCLIAALCYQIIQLARKNFAASDDLAEDDSKPRLRRIGYVDNFISLLYRYHREQRSVTFYASKLFISPKYLSLIIKEATGRSAAELIDEFVILEAKNLLRFSGKNIQQVAYELNFPNQSSFGKYFKHLTGMSPSEYQRT